MPNKSKNWPLILKILLKDRPRLEHYLEKSPDKFIQQCCFDLKAVPADEYCIIQKELSNKIKRQAKRLCQIVKPGLTMNSDKEYLQKIESWFLEKADGFELYRNFGRLISKTKPKGVVLNDRISILYAFCRSKGFSEKETVRKVHDCLHWAGIESKTFNFEKTKKRYLNILNAGLKEIARKTKKKKRTKREIIAEVRSELGPA